MAPAHGSRMMKLFWNEVTGPASRGTTVNTSASTEMVHGRLVPGDLSADADEATTGQPSALSQVFSRGTN